MVVLTDEDIVPPPGFRWLSLAQLHRLLRHDDLVNLNVRTVLSCLPAELTARAVDPARGAFTAVLHCSCRPEVGSRHRTGELLSWITGARSRTEVRTDRTALPAATIWWWRPTTSTWRPTSVAGDPAPALGPAPAQQLH